MKIIKDIQDELTEFLSDKIMDALLPPIIYIGINHFFALKTAVVSAITVAILFTIFRLIKKETVFYSLGGIAGVAFASAFALFSDNAANYFLPKIIGSAGLSILLLISTFIGRPAAAILSHLSRGWNFSWFMREDIKPAYQEVTIVWTILAVIRTIFQTVLYKRGSVTELGWQVFY
ncbi:MAG: DUF3159 domain-containing protein [Atopostipes sp.]|nr:DUF3159 domain-containing protein [Atopostipes sp.]